MSKYSDAALLKGDYAKMLKHPPKEADWNKLDCENCSEKSAQAIAKQIFFFQQSIDAEKEKLEVTTFSSLGPIKVLGITPIDGDLLRIDGVKPDNKTPASMIQHIEQLSLTFTKASIVSAEDETNDDGLQIGYVIFDELKERKKKRDAAKRKRSGPKKTAAKK